MFFSFLPDSSCPTLLSVAIPLGSSSVPHDCSLPWNSLILALISDEEGELPKFQSLHKGYTHKFLRPKYLPIYQMFIIKCFTNISTSVFHHLKSLSPPTCFFHFSLSQIPPSVQSPKSPSSHSSCFSFPEVIVCNSS